MKQTKKTFCQDCHEEVSISLEDTTMEEQFRGNAYHFQGITPTCHSGHPLSDPDVAAYNRKALHDTYRQAEHIISLQQIQALPQQYQIGKRPLSLLLQWGELTFTRYYDGDLPSKAYSQVLEEISASPEAYLQLLERNKDKISEKTYEKSKSAAEHRLQHRQKMTHVVQYLRQQDPSLSPSALHSLLYYCQGFYYGFFQENLLPDLPHGNEEGVFYEKLDQIIHESKCISGHCHHQEPFQFTVGEIELMQGILTELGCFSGKLLAKSIRMEPPWLHARASLASDSHEAPLLSQDKIQTFFQEIMEQQQIRSLHNLHLYGAEIYKLR